MFYSLLLKKHTHNKEGTHRSMSTGLAQVHEAHTYDAWRGRREWG